MQVKLEKLEKTNVKLEIETSPEMFEEGLSHAYHKNVKKYRVDGFRPGKVPRAILVKMYGEKSVDEMRELKRIFDPKGLLGRDNIFLWDIVR